MRPFFFLFSIAPLLPAAAQREDVWDLREFPSGAEAGYFDRQDGGRLGVPIDAGDFNNDGFTDVAASPFYANVPGHTAAGEIFVMLGDGEIEGQFDVRNTTRPKLRIFGAADYSIAGLEVLADDLDGDGYSDLVFSAAHNTFADTRNASGELTILYGDDSWGDTLTEIDLADIPDGVRHRIFLGQEAGDRLGAWFDTADIDGDGAMDLVTGMDMADGPSNNNTNSGALVILWNAAGMLPGETLVDLAAAETAPHMTIIHGRDSGDLLGATVMSEDVDSNGVIDIVASAGVARSGLSVSQIGYIGAGGGDGINNTLSNAGETYIFWDASYLRDIREAEAANRQLLDYTAIYGEDAAGYFGEEIWTADVNGDGRNDFISGGLTINVIGVGGGAAYLFEDTAALREMDDVDLLNPPENFVSCFAGTQAPGWVGDTIEMADITGDGKAEIFLSIPSGTPPFPNRSRAGFVPVVFGGQDFPKMPERIRIDIDTDPPLMLGRLIGADSGDLLAYSTALGDMNNDGIQDFLACAMQSDGFENRFRDAGEYYIFDSNMIARRAAVPLNITVNSSAPENEPVLTWTAGQAVYGEITGYRITTQALGKGAAGTFDVDTTELFRNDIPPDTIVTELRSVMQREGGEEELSAPISLSILGPVSVPPEGWLVH